MTTEHTTPETPAQDQPTQTPPQPERDENGRFKKGNKGGPGNPFARQSARLRQAALDAVSDDDIRDIITALKEKAKQGDVAASRLLLSYTIGKPGNAPDPDTMDQHELQTFIYNQTVPGDAFLQILKGTPVEMVLLMLRGLLPVLLNSKMKTASDFVAQAFQPEEEDDTEEGAADEPQPGTDNIPAWLWEVTQQHRAEAEPPAPAERPVSKRQSVPHEAGDQPPSQDAPGRLDPALLRLLLERITPQRDNPNPPPPTPTGETARNDQHRAERNGSNGNRTS